MLSGLSAFTVTPADEDGVVDTDHLQRLVSRLAGTDVDSIGVLGSTGGYMYLSPEQRERALRAATEAAGQTPVLAGIGAMRTSEVLRHATVVADAGASALLLAPVSYLPLTDADFAGLVRDVAAASDLPVCLYNNPGTTHFTMSAELVIELSRIENVKAVKNPATRDHATAAAQMAQLRENVPAGFVLGYSGDALINNPLKADADAWYSVIAGTLPDLTLSIWNTRGDAAAVDAAHSKAAPLWALFNAHGGIRVVPEILNLMGLGPVVLPKPLLPLPNAIVAEIEAALDILSTTGAAA